MPHDVLGGHRGADGHLEHGSVRPARGSRAALKLRGVEELSWVNVVEEGGLIEDAALATEQETEAVSPSEVLHSVTFTRMERDHFSEVGAEQRGKFSPGNLKFYDVIKGFFSRKHKP